MKLASLVPEFIKRPIRAYLHEKSFHRSQAGQDLWVIGEVFNEKRNGYFLDIGAHDGVYLSNTFILEKRYGWQGLCIEANPDSFLMLQQNRSSKCVNECVGATASTVGFIKDGVMGGMSHHIDQSPQSEAAEAIKLKTKPLEQILQEANAPGDIDYVSCDVEGAEDEVFLNFPFGDYRFKSMTIERPSAQLQARLSEFGYREVKTIPGLDSFYIHRDFESQYLDNVFNYFNKKKIIIGVST